MRSTITFPVPATTTSRFIVAADDMPQDVHSLACGTSASAYEAHVNGRLGTPQLKIERADPGQLRWDLSQITTSRRSHREAALGEADHIAVVTTVGPATDQPRGVQVARAAATAIATATDGIAADLVTGQVVAGGDERPRFVLADDWLGDVLPPFRANGRCTTPDPEHDLEGVNGCACVRLMTRGLRRFGLPELQISDIACPHDSAALNILRTTARRLLTDHWSWLATGPADRSRTIDADLTLTTGDYDEFWGVPRGDPSDTTFQVRLRPLTPRLISVGPPDGFLGTVNDWLWGGTLPTCITTTSAQPVETPHQHAAA
ncbi:hypothetical protein [Actinomadura rudentiformis]|uniref:Uncharacterized protein n=1 Tax=Actinomadura rudentiformis TaxID=359158 RepID=A0A6H9YWI7_9ACTN|nr:hypothetical protein [Actinomadura rudentiformis]KAB2346812.1 hypothetical protein F8566_21530 [Actinomadura rudentiformis]